MQLPNQFKPNCILKFKSKSNKTTTTFQQHSGFSNFKIGFHGSALNNFYSILHNGFDLDRSSDESLFGKGIYFAKVTKK